ncbi:hypothetical protein DYB30_001756 [Aphanomyces astaci]|uniref:DOMON domain-containing protein n=1 Tax=Aphanomyces astaci TaxID=112090 RepID=A0A397DPF1_APHAT|nr:hypothetical protein DYB30_001756 [Aphanomyces astaci]
MFIPLANECARLTLTLADKTPQNPQPLSDPNFHSTTRFRTMLKSLALAASIANVVAASSGCASDPLFAAQPTVAMGDSMTMRTFVKDMTACVQVTFPSAAKTGWTSIGFSQTPYMVNNPIKNVVVFDTASAATKLYLMASYESHNVPLQPGAMSITPIQGSVANGVISFTFERPLVATTQYDIDLDPTGATCVIWGYAGRAWPDKHSDYGAVYVALSTSTIHDQATIRPTRTPAIAAVTFGIMVVLGFIATYTSLCRRLLRRSLWPPSKCASEYALDPVNVGEAIIVLVYVGGAVVIGVTVNTTFADLNTSHRWCLIAGHVALQALVFLLLPVARGYHWELAFGTSHDRVLKFHRWLGGLCFVSSIVHLVLNIANKVAIGDSALYGPQDVVPLFGLLSFIAFATMSVVSIDPIRRSLYEVFYYHHRVASVVGLVFVMLHSPTVQYTMIFPLVIYGVSFISRFRGFFHRYQVTAVASSNTVLLTLPPTAQSTKWAKNGNPCAYFWVNIPSVSLLQWHPFSSIVTRDGQAIAFCLKSMAPDSFVDHVVKKVAAAPVGTPLAIVVGGPYGIPAIDVDTYSDLVLVAGGIGITPMLSIVNRFRHIPGTRTIHLYWVVRSPQDLLAADDVMFPLPPNVRPTFYVSQARESGAIASRYADDHIPYVHGKPVMDELINTTRFAANKAANSVGILACGPAGLVQETEWYSHKCGFDFHKEGFAF